MNLLLLDTADLIGTNRARISGRRLDHLNNVLKIAPGDTVKVGILNGAISTARIREIDSHTAELDLNVEPGSEMKKGDTQKPPPALPVTLIIALPRPKMLRRILQTCATLGVKKLIIINSYRVEKSYWQTPLLEPDSIHQQLILGLEQAGDTVLPAVSLHRLFKPFVEDLVPDIIADSRAFVAHPVATTTAPTAVTDRITLAIGPEGGFIPYEINKFIEVGFIPITLGPRILRVETAIPVLLSRLFGY